MVLCVNIKTIMPCFVCFSLKEWMLFLAQVSTPFNTGLFIWLALPNFRFYQKGNGYAVNNRLFLDTYIYTDLIFFIFSPLMYLWAQFFSTWKRVNCGKTSQNFSKFPNISPHEEKFSISPQLSYMESWNFSTWQFFLYEYNS